MRCPYCGGLNQEQAAFCVNCGRDLRRPLPNSQAQRPVTQTQQPSYPARQPNQPAYREANTPVQPQRPGRAANAPTQSFQIPTSTAAPTSRRQPVAADRTATPLPRASSHPEPEPPGPFPPRTMAQLEALLIGSQAYTVIESHIENGKKKCLSITYPRCSNWQQTATLLKAQREQQEQQYPTTLIRGVSLQQQDTYGFTNGQLQFDRDVRLGALVGNRYVIETGNGYSNDSLRFVINE
ncbi:MAG TPA: hypothetical protein VGM01_03640 [Ktedonobacteraceae bacterium]